MENDIVILTCVFEKFIKESINELHMNPLFCVGLPGFTRHYGLKYSATKLQTLQKQDIYIFLLLEIIVRGGISSVMVDTYKKADEKKRNYNLTQKN